MLSMSIISSLVLSIRKKENIKVRQPLQRILIPVIDQKIKDGNAGKLAGMVIGLKDLLCYQDHGAQAGSQILNGFKSTFPLTL